MQKTCGICLEVKPFSDFNIHSGTKDGYRGQCKKCQYQRAKELGGQLVRTEKVCPACSVLKPISEFDVARSRPDGHRSHCKACVWEREKQRRIDNPRRNENLRRYREKGREKYLERQKARYQENIEVERAKDREQYQERKEEICQKRKDARASGTEQSQQSRLKRNAVMRVWLKTENGQRYRVARACKNRCGISIDDYDRVYDEQEGKCRICERECPRYSKGRLVIDHCHKTKTFRALLCTQCNCAIGMFGENQQTFHNAVRYLEEFCEAM